MPLIATTNPDIELSADHCIVLRVYCLHKLHNQSKIQYRHQFWSLCFYFVFYAVLIYETVKHKPSFIHVSWCSRHGPWHVACMFVCIIYVLQGKYMKLVKICSREKCSFRRRVSNTMERHWETVRCSRFGRAKVAISGLVSCLRLHVGSCVGGSDHQCLANAASWRAYHRNNGMIDVHGDIATDCGIPGVSACHSGQVNFLPPRPV